MRSNRLISLLLCFVLWAFPACAEKEVITQAVTLPPPQVMIETLTPSPMPTAIPTPTQTPTVAEAIFPYTIEGLRQHSYQSGEIKIRSTLLEAEKYTSYLIEYPSDGLTITGVMNIPKGDGPFPVIVMNHGFFARSVYRSGDGTDRSAAFLAEYGYITISSDYRSWGDSDVAESFFYSGLAIDVINLLYAIPSIPQADPQRVGLWGHSMGGGVTMKVLTVLGGMDKASAPPVTVKAAVLYSTVSADHLDVIERWGNGCLGDIAAGERIFGCNSSDVVPLALPQFLLEAYEAVPTNPALLQAISPIDHLDAVNVPVQIHYGTEDGKTSAGTPPQWSVKLTQALRDAGKSAEMYEYKDQGHSFIGQPWFDFMLRVLRFFNSNL